MRGLRPSIIAVNQPVERHCRRAGADHRDYDPQQFPANVRRGEPVFPEGQHRPGQRKGKRENRVLELDHIQRQPNFFKETCSH